MQAIRNDDGKLVCVLGEPGEWPPTDEQIRCQGGYSLANDIRVGVFVRRKLDPERVVEAYTGRERELVDMLAEEAPELLSVIGPLLRDRYARALATYYSGGSAR